jgi:CO/xanthine dehydrogenase Mo-binding subunit
MQAHLDTGAYGGFTPNATGPHSVTVAPSYRIPVYASEVTRVYTHTVPRGNMRAPGSPQGTFALESAMDELAEVAGLEPIEFRRRNLLRTGEADAGGRRWVEHRGEQTLAAAQAEFRRAEPPPGWLHGQGIAVYSRATATHARTSLRLVEDEAGFVRVETALIETGAGSHTVLRQLAVDQLGLDPSQVQILGVATDALPYDAGAGGSRVTAGLATAMDVAAKAWRNRLGAEPIVVEVDESTGPPVGSYVVQIAQVGVDPETGELKVLEILTVVDVAAIINPRAHQMQIDGGVVMGFGFACTEDLEEADGQVWAATLGEYRLPVAGDVPRLRTVLVPGGVGVGSANVKNIGESTTPPVAAAIANAVSDAIGVRMRQLPLTAERILAAVKEGR